MQRLSINLIVAGRRVLLSSLFLFCIFISFSQSGDKSSVNDLEKFFKDPPSSASPWVFWYWYQASVSREGITADLEAMKQAGIAGAYLMPIKGPFNPPYMDSVVVQLTPPWWEMMRHAMKESKRLGLKLGMHVSDGFALAGGPWITPELSMQKIVWSKKNIKGGKLFHDTLELPETHEGYYRDIAVYAFPSPKGTGVSTRTVIPEITSSKPDSSAQLLILPDNKRSFNCEDQCWVQYEFEQPFTCRTIIIRSRNNYQSNRLLVEVSNDGKNFTSIGRLQPPRHGWQDWDSDYTHSIPATTARFFRFIYDKSGSEPGAEDLDAAKWKPSLKVAGIELSSEASIDQYEGKNGEVWRISKFTTKEQVPDEVCIPLNRIINLTGKLDKNGRLNWKVPPGDWTIIRMGHTSTGHRNETGGGGKGLECDKFNPEAIRLQFDQWYGEAIRQAGPELAKSVLGIFHVDSWECGSQNWSNNFREEFKKRRGYDPVAYLPAMAGIPIQTADVSERFLYDIRKTIAELVKDKFYGTLAGLAKKKGVVFTAESVAPTMHGDGMLHYQSVDVPMGEFWLRSPTHDKPNDMLDAISGAHVYGKNIIQAEAFTQLRMAWDEHPGMLKTLADRNFALGINKLVYHVFMHNPWPDRKPGMTLDAIGLYFQRDQTWWKQSRAWVDYARRCQLLLQAGKPVVDIAVFTGEDLPRRCVLPDRLIPSLPGLFGAEKVALEKQRLENEGQPLRTLPAGVTHSANMADPENWIDPLRGYAYDSYNTDALLKLSTVRDGKIQLSTGASYRLLVLPGSHKMVPNGSFMSLETAAKIRDLVHNGATVLINEFPSASLGLKNAKTNDEKVRLMMSELKKLPPSKKSTASGTQGNINLFRKGRVIRGPFTEESFEGIGMEPDFLATDPSGKRAEGIAWTHRSGEGFDIYFVSNQKDLPREIQLSLRIKGKVPETWDPVSGEINTSTVWQIVKGRTVIPVHLEENGSLFIVLKQSTEKTGNEKGRNWLNTQPVATINGPWQVKFDPAFGGPEQPVVFYSLTDWSKNMDSSIRYYSGEAEYRNTFTWDRNSGDKQVWINTGTVANIAEIFVNGVSCGIVWTAPFRVDITKALKNGSNEVRIRVANTWANRLIGDHRLPVEKRVTNTIAPYRLEGKPLLSAGLLGPVQIEMAAD